METIRRRSRTHRSRRGKKLELSPRDLEIFRVLFRYRYLPSTSIHAFVGGASETRFKERLGDLFHEGYLDRPTKQWELAGCRHRPAVYEIGRGGLKVLRHSEAEDLESRTWLGTQAHLQFHHSLMICDVLANVELESRTLSHLRFIPWSEIAAKMPNLVLHRSGPFRFMATTPHPLTVIPDAIFGIEYHSGETRSYRFFALEADRGTMPIMRSQGAQSSYLKKLINYRAVFAANLCKTQLGVPNLLVLTVTTSERRKETIMRWLGTVAGGASAGFLFKSTTEQITKCAAGPECSYLKGTWMRTGFPPMCISTP